MLLGLVSPFGVGRELLYFHRGGGGELLHPLPPKRFRINRPHQPVLSSQKLFINVTWATLTSRSASFCLLTPPSSNQSLSHTCVGNFLIRLRSCGKQMWANVVCLQCCQGVWGATAGAKGPRLSRSGASPWVCGMWLWEWPLGPGLHGVWGSGTGGEVVLAGAEATHSLTFVFVTFVCNPVWVWIVLGWSVLTWPHLWVHYFLFSNRACLHPLPQSLTAGRTVCILHKSGFGFS